MDSDCVLCGSPQGGELSPRGVCTVDRFLQQLNIISSCDGGVSKKIPVGGTSPPPRVCGDCLCDMTLATERAREVVGAEGVVRSLQQQLLRTTRQLQTLVGSFLEGMRPLEENAKRRRVGQQEEELHGAIINVVGMLRNFEATTASKSPATGEEEVNQEMEEVQDEEPNFPLDFLQIDHNSTTGSQSQDEGEWEDDVENEEPAEETTGNIPADEEEKAKEEPEKPLIVLKEDKFIRNEKALAGLGREARKAALFEQKRKWDQVRKRCPACGKKFARYCLREHLRKWHGLRVQGDKPQRTKDSNSFIADRKALAGLDKEARRAAYNAQLRKWVLTKIPCPLCGKNYARSSMKPHIAKMHDHGRKVEVTLRMRGRKLGGKNK